MLKKINLLCFVLMLASAFVDNKWIPFHLICLFITIQLKRWQPKNKDVIYVLLLFLFQCLLLFFVKKDQILWIVYDLLAILLGVYFLMRSLRFFFCK